MSKKQYHVNFELITVTELPMPEGFETEERTHDMYRSERTYDTPEQAIDAAIKALNEIKENE